MVIKDLLRTFSHELPDNVFEKGDIRPVKQTRKKIIKKKVPAATNATPSGKKRTADEVCINQFRTYRLSFVFPQPRGGERYGDTRGETSRGAARAIDCWAWRKWAQMKR